MLDNMSRASFPGLFMLKLERQEEKTSRGTLRLVSTFSSRYSDWFNHNNIPCADSNCPAKMLKTISFGTKVHDSSLLC